MRGKQPGSPKTGGRKKGTPNKLTELTRDTFGRFLEAYINSGELTDDWKVLEPRERVNIAVKMAAFVVPQPKSVDVNITSVNNKSLTDKLLELQIAEDELDK